MIETQTDRQTDRQIHTHTQATTILECQNWPRVIKIIALKPSVWQSRVWIWPSPDQGVFPHSLTRCSWLWMASFLCTTSAWLGITYVCLVFDIFSFEENPIIRTKHFHSRPMYDYKVAFKIYGRYDTALSLMVLIKWELACEGLIPTDNCCVVSLDKQV